MMEDYTPLEHVTVKEIQAAVCRRFRIPAIEMMSQRRGRDVAHPRQVAMYLSKQLTPYSFPNIGRMFGGRDHTTVMYAVKAVEQRMAADSICAGDVEGLRKGLAG